MKTGRLAGKNALVCGGESGIGAAIVRRFHSEGATIIAAGVQGNRLAALAKELDQRVSDAVRSSGFGHHLSKHRA